MRRGRSLWCVRHLIDLVKSTLLRFTFKEKATALINPGWGRVSQHLAIVNMKLRIGQRQDLGDTVIAKERINQIAARRSTDRQPGPTVAS